MLGSFTPTYNIDLAARVANAVGASVTPNGPGAQRATGNFVPRSRVEALIALSKRDFSPQQVDDLIGQSFNEGGQEHDMHGCDQHALMLLVMSGSVRLTDEQISRLMSMGTAAASSVAHQALLERERDKLKQDGKSSLEVLLGSVDAAANVVGLGSKSEPSIQQSTPGIESVLTCPFEHQFGPVSAKPAGGSVPRSDK